MSQPCEYEEDFEAGTIPTIPILSLNEGVKYLSQNFQKIRKKEEELTKYTYFSLKKLNFIEIYSKSTSLNVISFNIKNLNSMDVANILNEKYSICVRAGLHCAPLIHQKQNTQKTGAVRVALDFNNTFYEIDVLVNALVEIFNSSH